MLHQLHAKKIADELLANKPKVTQEQLDDLNNQISYWPQVILVAVIVLIAIATI